MKAKKKIVSGPTTQAVVLVSYGSQGIVMLPDGERTRCKFRRQVGRPFCGDRVMVARADDESLVVESILPRDNYFVRTDDKGRKQPVAANLDQVAIVIAMRPLPSQDLLERYLLAVQSLGIKPLIVLNKIDLDVADDDRLVRIEVITHLPDYQALGYEVIFTSCVEEPGIKGLREHLEGKTSILVGQSGVGKSSLINELIPDLGIQTKALSDTTGKGTHTTTSTMLYEFGENGHLIDSPGVWEFGIWKFEDLELADGFPEFHPYLGQCKFNNCLHNSEPGCAIKQATEDGHILEWRYQSYLRLLSQNT